MVPLRSRLFADSRALAACLVDDRAHIVPGARGEHVQLVQRALVTLGDRSITGAEYVQGLYGKNTAAAVLWFKKQRRIINFSYQKTEDNIVGKMTIRALDNALIAVQDLPSTPY